MKANGKRKTVRVAHVLYSFDSIGGLENGLVNILNNLRQDGFFHVVCSLSTLGSIKERVSARNVRYYGLNKREGNDLSIPFKLYSIFKKEKIDVVHLRNWASMLEGFVAAKFAQVNKIIYSEHGRHFEDIWYGHTLKTALKRYILNHVDVLLCVSADLAREMAGLYKLQRKAKVIINGVDIDKFIPLSHSEARKKYGWSANETIIGTVARLDRGKNLDQLIEDISILGKENRLVIVGDGPEKSKLENLIQQQGQEGRIRLMGHQDDIPGLLNCFDVFALPSGSEGLSNVILEAMACGLPVVAYDVGGNKELIVNEKGGYLVDLNNRTGFSKAIESLIRDSVLRKQMGDYNRVRVSKNFSVKNMAASYSSMYALS